MLLKTEDFENVRVSSLLSLGLVSEPHKLARRYNGTVMI
jgi:hypothetical protein